MGPMTLWTGAGKASPAAEDLSGQHNDAARYSQAGKKTSLSAPTWRRRSGRKLVAKRKAAYEAIHQETRQGGRPGKAGDGKAKMANMVSFVSDTSGKTGKPERTIRRDATRAKALGPDLDRIAGTSLDKGAELDAPSQCPTATFTGGGHQVDLPPRSYRPRRLGLPDARAFLL